MAAKTWVGWGLALAGVLATGPLVLGRGDPALAQAQAEIARMSEVKRAALDRKYRQYQALNEEQRANYRVLHQLIEADRIKGAVDAETLRDYCDWLKTIDAWQQDELAHLSDPTDKIVRVEAIMKLRRENALHADTKDDESPPEGNRPFQLPLLAEDQLTKVFDALAARLSEEERKEAESLHGLKRFGVQVKLLKKTIKNPEKFIRAISPAELVELIKASGNTEWNSQLIGAGDPVMHRRRAIQGIFASCRAQTRRESAAATDQELRAFFNTLKLDEQDHLLQLSADEFKAQLRQRRLESDPDVAELQHLMGDEFSAAKRRMDWLRRGGPNGPGGPPDDRRGPGGPGGPGGRPSFDRGQFGDGPPPPRPGEDGGPPDGPPPGPGDEPPPK